MSDIWLLGRFDEYLERGLHPFRAKAAAFWDLTSFMAFFGEGPEVVAWVDGEFIYR